MRPNVQSDSFERACTHDRQLTPKELELLKLLCAGHSNKTAGFALGVSRRTTETHRDRIMEKLQASSPVHLGVIAALKGLA